MKTCRIGNCKNVPEKGRVCQMHWSRWARHKSFDVSPNWPNLRKGKPHFNNYGYLRVNINGKRVLQHRHVMEQRLGRKLNPQERVHHINHDRADNRIENLELFKNNSEHIKKAHPLRWHERKDRYSTSTLNNIFSSLAKPSNPNKDCFCGSKFMARNLCGKHYQWVYKHKFI